MKMNFRDIGVHDKLVMFSNGKEVADYFETMLSDIESGHREAET